MNNIKFNWGYFLSFVLLLFTETYIALYVHDSFIRPFFGDFLVVFLIYCFLMSFLNGSKIKIALFVLIFSFMIEWSQYFNLVAVLGLQKYEIARVVMGNSFAVTDLVCYFLGIALVLLIEKMKLKK